MSLFSEIDRLITEHGSAAILRERISLVRDQNEALQKKVAELEGELAVLKKKNAELDGRVAPQAAYKVKWGCLVFEGDENLYCPACYIDRGKKMPTSRSNSSSRYCTSCKTVIPSG